MPPLLGSEEAGVGSVLTAAGGAEGGGTVAVDKILPGTGIAVSPPGGTGDVTISNTGVLSVSAGPGINLGGSGAAPVINNNLLGSFAQSPVFGTAPRFFAVDNAAGNDANLGYSDVSQAAAGLVAVKTLGRLLQILPRFGQGRACRVAVASGTYSSDTFLVLDGLIGMCSSSFNSLLFIGTGTVPSAGSVAFAGNLNDSLCAGFVTATGMNAAGYNSTAYSVAADGTPTITMQIAGGGSPGFTAASSARPYGCRIRFDAATATAALRNHFSGIINVTGAGSVILSVALPAAPAAGDVFYIEMPGVIVPGATEFTGTGEGASNATIATQFCGFQFGTLGINRSSLVFCGCEGTIVTAGGGVDLRFQDTILDEAAAAFDLRSRGISLRCTSYLQNGGTYYGVSTASTSTTSCGFSWTACESVGWERSASASGILKEGGGLPGGNNVQETIGTNSSTAHGAACQIFGTAAPGPGYLQCGLFAGGGVFAGRIKLSNMGANPGVRINGAGLGVALEGITGGVADGNTDVGVDLGPDGLSGNTIGAIGCAIAVVGTPSLTGSNGDVRTSGGEIVSWAALLATGFADRNGNRFCSTTGPVAIVGKFSGTLVQQPSGVSATYLSDTGEVGNITINDAPQNYPTSFRLITRLRVYSKSGTGGNALVVTLYKNATSGGAGATTQTVTIPASSAPGTSGVDLAHPILFADGDTFDVCASMASGTGDGPYFLSAVIEGPC